VLARVVQTVILRLADGLCSFPFNMCPEFLALAFVGASQVRAPAVEWALVLLALVDVRHAVVVRRIPPVLADTVVPEGRLISEEVIAPNTVAAISVRALVNVLTPSRTGARAFVPLLAHALVRTGRVNAVGIGVAIILAAALVHVEATSTTTGGPAVLAHAVGLCRGGTLLGHAETSVVATFVVAHHRVVGIVTDGQERETRGLVPETLGAPEGQVEASTIARNAAKLNTVRLHFTAVRVIISKPGDGCLGQIVARGIANAVWQILLHNVHHRGG
jgi:hypothetical protein